MTKKSFDIPSEAVIFFFFFNGRDIKALPPGQPPRAKLPSELFFFFTCEKYSKYHLIRILENF